MTGAPWEQDEQTWRELLGGGPTQTPVTSFRETIVTK